MNMEITANERIQGLRKVLGLSRKEFCAVTHISYHTLENVERGRQKPTVEIFEKIGEHWPEYIVWLVLNESEWKLTAEDEVKVKLAAQRAAIVHGLKPHTDDR